MRSNLTTLVEVNVSKQLINYLANNSIDWHGLNRSQKENFVLNHIFINPKYADQFEPSIFRIIDFLDGFFPVWVDVDKNDSDGKVENKDEIYQNEKPFLERFQMFLFFLNPEEKEELQAYLFDYRREMVEKGYPSWKINLITLGNILRVVVPKLLSAILGLARFWEKFNIG